MRETSKRRTPPSVAFITMGCAKNEVDSARMQELLSHAGFALEDDPACADAVVVNTCSFIQSATEESIEAILDAAELENVACGDAKLVVAGCMPSRYGADLEVELDEVSSFVPCSREDDIVSILSGLLGFDSVSARQEVPLSQDVPSAVSQDASWAVSAYVKISDGCDRFCSYCAIPYIRGRYHSFTYDTIEGEVRKQVSRGVREIVLIAQDTGRWGDDFQPPETLASLMSRLADAFPSTWFRVMYLQPEGITDELIETVASHENICSYFDIPLQHVSPEILRSMNRSGNRQQFVELIDRIKARIPQAVLRTTLIAGFPGETEEQFEDLLSFVEEGYFDYVGVFPYSREEGTRAWSLDGQLDESEKLERAQRIRDVADAVCAQLVAQRIDQSFDVLVEGCEEDGQLFGRAMCQAPEVDGVVYLQEGRIGEIKRVRIIDTLLYEMEGE